LVTKYSILIDLFSGFILKLPAFSTNGNETAALTQSDLSVKRQALQAYVSLPGSRRWLSFNGCLLAALFSLGKRSAL